MNTTQFRKTLWTLISCGIPTFSTGILQADSVEHLFQSRFVEPMSLKCEIGKTESNREEILDAVLTITGRVGKRKEETIAIVKRPKDASDSINYYDLGTLVKGKIGASNYGIGVISDSEQTDIVVEDFSVNALVSILIPSDRGIYERGVRLPIFIEGKLACAVEYNTSTQQLYVSKVHTVFSEKLPFDKKNIFPPMIKKMTDIALTKLATEGDPYNRTDAAADALMAFSASNPAGSPFPKAGFSKSTLEALKTVLYRFLTKIEEWNPQYGSYLPRADEDKLGEKVKNHSVELGNLILTALVAGETWGKRDAVHSRIQESENNNVELSQALIRKLVFNKPHDQPLKSSEKDGNIDNEIGNALVSTLRFSYNLDMFDAMISTYALVDNLLIDMRRRYLKCESTAECPAK